ncbi:MAG: hypothetical protein WCI96_08805, partial [Planctomycetota bacterium]
MPRSTVPTDSRCAAATLLAALAACTLLASCDSGMQRIDRETNDRLRSSAEQLGGGSIYPEIDGNRYESGSNFPKYPEVVSRPPTEN